MTSTLDKCDKCGTSIEGSCTLATGVRGRCVEVRQCPTVLRTYRQSRPLVCVSPGEAKVVCCPASNLQLLQDISAPIVNFQCGQNIYQPFKLYTESVGPIRFLRPESINKTVLNKISSGDDPQRRPGVPLAALNDPKVFQLRPGPILGALRVLGGVTALKNNWPWMALLGEKNGKEIRWFYAGVLISDRWVLSALHCVLATNDNDGAAHEDFSIVDIIPHPEYFHPQAYHDVVLLKLDHKVKLKPFINPVCLPWGRESSHSQVYGQNVIHPTAGRHTVCLGGKKRGAEMEPLGDTNMIKFGGNPKDGSRVGSVFAIQFPYFFPDCTQEEAEVTRNNLTTKSV
nr:clotting factor B-like [Cherax quadricarinatus]